MTRGISKEQLKNQYELAKSHYILLQASPETLNEFKQNPTFRNLSNAYFNADNTFKKQAQPLYFHLVENILNDEKERLLGDVDSDPVYVFLKDAKEKVNEYSINEFESDYKSDDPGDDLTLSQIINTRETFIDILIDVIETRKKIIPNKNTCWGQDLNFEKIYGDINEMYTNSQGVKRDNNLNQFISKLPKFSWDFYEG